METYHNVDKAKERQYVSSEVVAELVSTVYRKLNRIETLLATEHERWESITQIRKRFGISYYKAKQLCETPNVRCHKEERGWPRYSVSDCNRVFAGESLPLPKESAAASRK